MARLRAAIITDIHYGTNKLATAGKKAARYIPLFVRAANNAGVDAVIDMGDRISHPDPDRENNLTRLTDCFNKLSAPRYSLTGNHDIAAFKPSFNESATGCPASSYSVDVGGFHIVCWNPVHPASTPGPKVGFLVVKKEDLNWLKKDLTATGKPTIVFSHIPLDNVSELRSDDGKDDVGARFGYPKKGATIRRIMEDSGKVVLCMSGHIHQNRERIINGIPYIAQQSWAHQYNERPYKPLSRTWSLLEIDDKEIRLTLKGSLKKTYSYPLNFGPSGP